MRLLLVVLLLGGCIGDGPTLAPREASLALRALGGADGLSTFDGLQIVGHGTSEVFLNNNVPSDEGEAGGSGWMFTRAERGSPEERLTATVASLVHVINLRSTLVRAKASPRPGYFVLSAKVANAGPIVVRAFRNQRAWAPLMRVQMRGVPTRKDGVVTVDVFAGGGFDHRLRVGEEVSVTSSPRGFQRGEKVVTSTPTKDVFTYAEDGPDGTGKALEFITSGDDLRL